jgi:NAD(P)-dependent dehydrogenase (short-subunit alcohol dehydrogenase family)
MESETVFITGVSSGLGEGIARAYLERGAKVYGVSRRRPETLEADFPGQVIWRALDLSAGESGRAIIASLLAEVSSLDAVVLNAGMLPPIADLADTSLETLRSTMELNVWANQWIAKAVFATVPEVAHVVAISSGAAVSGARGWNAYAISKAALNMWAKLYAAERPETHFTALAPGLIDTAMQDYLSSLPDDERFATVERLKAAKGTEDMPDATTAGRRCVEAFPRFKAETESGSFIDIRKFS